MEIKFDWKFFKTDKPKVGSIVIFFRDDEYYLAKYLEPDYDIYRRTDSKPVYQFVGNTLNIKTLKIKSKLSIPIYPPCDYNNGYDSYDFKWDYYEWKEIK
jgi:hypothetical protein